MKLGEEASDESLFESFRRGNQRDFERLLRRYERPLFAFLYRQTGNAQQAEDLFQETWIRVYRSVHRFEVERRFSPWLYQIAYRLSVDSYRRKKREGNEPAESMEQHAEAHDAEEMAAKQELRGRMRALIDTLEVELRTVLILKHYQGLSYEEIADVMTCPVGTVKSRMHRAIFQLKEKVGRAGLFKGTKNREM